MRQDARRLGEKITHSFNGLESDSDNGQAVIAQRFTREWCLLHANRG
jgi:hypothetical protein